MGEVVGPRAGVGAGSVTWMAREGLDRALLGAVLAAEGAPGAEAVLGLRALAGRWPCCFAFVE